MEFAPCGSSCSSWRARKKGMLDAYIVSGGFSRWIGDVFGDRALADELRVLEGRHRAGLCDETLTEMAGAVRGRHDLADDELEAGVR